MPRAAAMGRNNMTDKNVNYLQPKNLEELQESLKKLSDNSVILAGGTDLLVTIREKNPNIDTILSICDINEMKGIAEMDGWIRIGAMVTHQESVSDKLINLYFHALKMACNSVGSLQIRNKGTLGGSIMNANPAGDVLPCVMLYNGEIETMDQNGIIKRINVHDFISQSGKPNLKKNEILTAIWLPLDFEKKSCFVKLGSRTEVTIAQISFCMSWKKTNDENRQIEAYIGAVDSKPFKVEKANILLENNPFDTEKLDSLSLILSNQIREIRENRKRESKLKIYENEKLYKERAVKGVLYDAVSYMKINS